MPEVKTILSQDLGHEMLPANQDDQFLSWHFRDAVTHGPIPSRIAHMLGAGRDMRHVAEKRALLAERRTKPQQNCVRNQFASGTRSIQMAAAVSQSFGLQEEVFVSRATIQLQMPPRARIYEWHTQVVGAPASTPTATSPETECVRERAPGATETATPKGNYYTPPRILGTEAKAKNLPQTLGNFFEAERYASAWNRVTE